MTSLVPIASLYVAALIEPVLNQGPIVPMWKAVFLKLDMISLSELEHETWDMFPWRPFYLLARAMESKGYNVRRELQHLEELALDHIASKGCTKVSLDDLCASYTAKVPIPMQSVKRVQTHTRSDWVHDTSRL